MIKLKHLLTENNLWQNKSTFKKPAFSSHWSSFETSKGSVYFKTSVSSLARWKKAENRWYDTKPEDLSDLTIFISEKGASKILEILKGGWFKNRTVIFLLSRDNRFFAYNRDTNNYLQFKFTNNPKENLVPLELWFHESESMLNGVHLGHPIIKVYSKEESIKRFPQVYKR